jgi:NADH-quinone oxidoreductase subunit M
MVYERTHTRQLAELRALPLHRQMPFAALVFVLAGMASMGMPGFSGFPAELTILIGAWKTQPRWAALGGVGVLVAAAFTLRVIQVSFFGATDTGSGRGDEADGHAPDQPPHVGCYDPITWPERVGAILLIGTSVYLGLKPDALLDWIGPALQSPLMQAALKGGAP